jgi:hypothetical protein
MSVDLAEPTVDWVDPALPFAVNLQVVRDVLADHAESHCNATIEDFDADLVPYINDAVFRMGAQLAARGGFHEDNRPDASYNGEAWTISISQYESASGPLPVCSIYDKQGELVFHAVQHKDELAVACNSLIDTDLLQVTKVLLSEPDLAQTGIHHVKAELDRLGGFAPDGSKALITAHIALKQSDTSEIKGQLYQFNRTEAGGLEVSDVLRQTPLYQMSSSGQIACGSVAPDDRQAFNHMYNRLTDFATSRAAQTQSPTVKATVGRD